MYRYISQMFENKKEVSKPYGYYLYTRSNIIGYSGELNSRPTVFFTCPVHEEDGSVRTVVVGGKMQIVFWFGRITQKHLDPNNVGRGLVYESWSYSIANMHPDYLGPDGLDETVPVLQEACHKSEFDMRRQRTADGFTNRHIGRSVFTAVSPGDVAVLNILERAITAQPNIKKMYKEYEHDQPIVLGKVK